MKKGKNADDERETELNKKIGNNLRAIRISKSLTLVQGAKLIGINPSVLYNIEVGDRMLNISNLYKLSKAYGISMDKIINIESENIQLCQDVSIDPGESERALFEAYLRVLDEKKLKIVKFLLDELHIEYTVKK